MKNEKQLISRDDLQWGSDLALNEKQLNHIFSKTPSKFIKQRPGKGGGDWNYVEVGYIIKTLNLMFGWDWDFQILNETINLDFKEVIVKGQLIVRTGGKTIIKNQFGNKEIIFRKGTSTPLSIGNDIKAASSDALKKCASMIGIAQDIYLGKEMKEIEIITEEPIKDIAGMLCSCESVDDVQVLWGTLTPVEQEKYLKLFKTFSEKIDQ